MYVLDSFTGLFFLVLLCSGASIPSTSIQEVNCMERETRDNRPPSKLQSAIYYALDGDQVNTLIMLAQRTEDPWVVSNRLYTTFLLLTR